MWMLLGLLIWLALRIFGVPNGTCAAASKPAFPLMKHGPPLLAPRRLAANADTFGKLTRNGTEPVRNTKKEASSAQLVCCELVAGA